MIGIKEITPFIIGDKIGLNDLPEIKKMDEVKLEYFNNCGIETIYDSGKISSFDLALGASKQLLEETDTDPLKVDVIIYIKSRTPEYFISSESTRLKHAIKADNALAFAISDLGCVDISMALKMAKDLLLANRSYENVLIAYGNKQFSNSRFRYPVNVLGDGGIAVLVGRVERNKIIDIKIDSNGKYWDLFKIDYKDKAIEDYKEVCSDVRKYGFELAIESKNRFEDINRLILKSNNLSQENMDYFLMQNISKRAYEYYEAAFNIKIFPVCNLNLSQYGHLGSVDIMLNYLTAIKEGMFKEGDKVLIMNNSPVAAWSSMIIEV